MYSNKIVQKHRMNRVEIMGNLMGKWRMRLQVRAYTHTHIQSKFSVVFTNQTKEEICTKELGKIYHLFIY